MEDTSDESSLIVIILDSNPMQRIVRRNPQQLTQCLDSICVFANAHLMQGAQNGIAALASDATKVEFLYPSQNSRMKEIRQIDGQYEKFTQVEKTIKLNMASMVKSAGKNLFEQNAEPMLAGSIAMALCYIARLQREKPPGCKLNARMLLLTGSLECASQYMTYMNVFFTAQKQNVVLDVCALDESMTLLQQGCDITGGQYLKLPQTEGLLQYLLWVFLPDPAIRNKLVFPPATKVDYRAACFCHRELIDIGYVCSVCLSIFCKSTPICITCKTVFKEALKVKKKKTKA